MFTNEQVYTTGQKPFTFGVSVMLQVGLVTTLFLLPLFQAVPLPEVVKVTIPILAPQLKAMPVFIKHYSSSVPAPSSNYNPTTTARTSPKPFVPPGTQPLPKNTGDHFDVAPPEIGTGAPCLNCLPNGVPGGTGTDLNLMVKTAPPPTAPPATAPPTRIVQGGNVQAAALLLSPQPAYPSLARAARQQGPVTLKAIISRDGTIQSLKVLSGPPLLVQAALEAVKQWRYRPTLLNQTPVEVETTITVNFVLNN